jgi:hypothetical protein
MLPRCEIRHKDFKMADDIQQKNIAMQLRASNTVSDQTVLEELGFDTSKEDARKAKEQEKRLADMRKTQVAQAEIEAKVAVIRVQSEIEINRIRMQAQQEDAERAVAEGTGPPQDQAQGQEAAGGQPGQSQQPQGGQQGKEPIQLLGPTGGNGQGGNGQGQPAGPPPPPSPIVLETMVNNFIKSTPPNEREYQISILAQSDPMMASAIRKHLVALERGRQEAAAI